MEKMIMFCEDKLEKWGIYLISAPLILMTIIEVLNALGRKLFIPFPCALEAVESLLVISVYLGVSIVALEGEDMSTYPCDRQVTYIGAVCIGRLCQSIGHINLRLSGVWVLEGGLQGLSILEMRIGVYRFPLWPFKLIFALGMTMLMIQLAMNVVKFSHKALGNNGYAGMKKRERRRFLFSVHPETITG